MPQKESEVGKGSGEDTRMLKKLFSGHHITKQMRTHQGGRETSEKGHGRGE